MEIVLTNTNLVLKSRTLITKGTLNFDVDGASQNDSYSNAFFLMDCTGLSKVTGINYVPCKPTTSSEFRVCKFNKQTRAFEEILVYNATDAELGQVKHLDLNVTLNENEYIGIRGHFYFKTTGGESYYYTPSNDTLVDNQSVLLYYNIEGFE